MSDFEFGRDRFDRSTDRNDSLAALCMPRSGFREEGLQSKEEIYRIIFDGNDGISFKEQLVKLQELRSTHKDSPRAVELLDEVCFELARVNALTSFVPHFF
jgi:hypothetical protein